MDAFRAISAHRRATQDRLEERFSAAWMTPARQETRNLALLPGAHTAGTPRVRQHVSTVKSGTQPYLCLPSGNGCCHAIQVAHGLCRTPGHHAVVRLLGLHTHMEVLRTSNSFATCSAILHSSKFGPPCRHSHSFVPATALPAFNNVQTISVKQQHIVLEVWSLMLHLRLTRPHAHDCRTRRPQLELCPPRAQSGDAAIRQAHRGGCTCAQTAWLSAGRPPAA